MKIEVTPKHIKLGIPCSADQCPIALAMKEAGYDDVFVGSDAAEWGTGEADYLTDWARLPVEVREFVERFDSNEPVAPFSFELKQL